MPVALITGGAGGVGEGITRSLAADGHHVAIGYRVKATRAEALASELRDRGAPAVALQCDLADVDSVGRVVSEAGRVLGAPVQVLVNNAAVRYTKPFLTVTRAEWEHVLDVNVLGSVAAMQAALPAMVDAGWGRVVNVSSPSGQVPYTWGAAYGAAKAALNLVSRVVAVEFARKGITCNVVLPGLVMSDMLDGYSTEVLDRLVAEQAPGRMISAEEVGQVVAFLASDAARMVNGQEVGVDGAGTLLVRYPDAATKKG